MEVRMNLKDDTYTSQNINPKISKKLLLIILSVFFIIFVCIGFYNKLSITNYTFKSNKLPAAFDGFRIVQISDLHCEYFGKNQVTLIEAISEFKPNMILFTGDMIDADHRDLTSVEDLLKGIHDLAPIYQVRGNHEYDSYTLNAKLNSLYRDYGVNDLNGRNTTISINNENIYLYGIDYLNKDNISNSSLSFLSDNTFNLLLFHDSNDFDILSYYNFDLAFAGHSHGGLVRIPFLGGLIGNDGSLFPKYDGGYFKEHDAVLISSRGLGKAELPRFYNPPELVFVTLHTTE